MHAGEPWLHYALRHAPIDDLQSTHRQAASVQATVAVGSVDHGLRTHARRPQFQPVRGSPPAPISSVLLLPQYMRLNHACLSTGLATQNLHAAVSRLAQTLARGFCAYPATREIRLLPAGSRPRSRHNRGETHAWWAVSWARSGVRMLLPKPLLILVRTHQYECHCDPSFFLPREA